jgi:hypothetical protein
MREPRYVSLRRPKQDMARDKALAHAQRCKEDKTKRKKRLTAKPMRFFRTCVESHQERSPQHSSYYTSNRFPDAAQQSRRGFY